MNALGQAAGLAGVALPFVVSPGASVTLTVHHTVTGNRRAGAQIAAGTVAGLFTVAGLLTWSPAAGLVAGHRAGLRWLDLVGGAVLAVLGLRMLLSGLRRPPPGPDAASPPATGRTLVRQAYLGLVLNPKALALYLVVVPALGRGAPPPYLPFACVHAAMQVGWLLLVGAVATRLTRRSSASWRRGLSVAAGTFLVVSAVLVWRAAPG